MPKCQHCGSEYISGELHCPNCFEPVPIDFDSSKSGKDRSGSPSETGDSWTGVTDQDFITLGQNNDNQDPFATFFNDSPPAKGNPLPAGPANKPGEDRNPFPAGAVAPKPPVSMVDQNLGKPDLLRERGYLVITNGDFAGTKLSVTGESVTIGRWAPEVKAFVEIDLSPYDPSAKISRKHARITRENGVYYLEDIGSTNGTYLNKGDRLLPGSKTPLQNGDEIIIGMTFLKFMVV